VTTARIIACMGVSAAKRVLITFQGLPHQATRTAKVWNVSGAVGDPGQQSGFGAEEFRTLKSLYGTTRYPDCRGSGCFDALPGSFCVGYRVSR